MEPQEELSIIRPGVVIAAVVIALAQSLGLVLYAAAIGVASIGTPNSGSAAPVAVIIFLVFAAGIGACAWGMWHGRQVTRTPFLVIQFFGLVTGWTLTQGDGDSVHAAGYAVLVLSVVGIALVMSPGVGSWLRD